MSATKATGHVQYAQERWRATGQPERDLLPAAGMGDPEAGFSGSGSGPLLGRMNVLAEQHPHPLVRHLAGQFLGGDLDAFYPLWDAVEEHAQWPDPRTHPMTDLVPHYRRSRWGEASAPEAHAHAGRLGWGGGDYNQPEDWRQGAGSADYQRYISQQAGIGLPPQPGDAAHTVTPALTPPPPPAPPPPPPEEYQPQQHTPGLWSRLRGWMGFSRGDQPVRLARTPQDLALQRALMEATLLDYQTPRASPQPDLAETIQQYIPDLVDRAYGGPQSEWLTGLKPSYYHQLFNQFREQPHALNQYLGENWPDLMARASFLGDYMRPGHYLGSNIISQLGGLQGGNQDPILGLRRGIWLGDYDALPILGDALEEYSDNPRLGQTMRAWHGKWRDYQSGRHPRADQPRHPLYPEPVASGRDQRALAAQAAQVGQQRGYQSPLQYASVRSPAKGALVRGMFYPGGRFLPHFGAVEKAPYENYQNIQEQRAQLPQTAKYRRADGSYSVEGALEARTKC